MTQQIGETSGKIWQFLNEHPGATTEEIRKDLKIDNGMVHLGLGWLAREGKLLFESKDSTVRVSLTGA